MFLFGMFCICKSATHRVVFKYRFVCLYRSRGPRGRDPDPPLDGWIGQMERTNRATQTYLILSQEHKLTFFFS